MCFLSVHNQPKTLFCNYFSNPKVQVYMLDNGIMSTLIRILSTKTSQTLRNRILYAMSSLLRHFPYAQQHFLQHGGLQALSTVFNAGGTEKLQLKAVTLINDLVTEKVIILLFILYFVYCWLQYLNWNNDTHFVIRCNKPPKIVHILVRSLHSVVLNYCKLIKQKYLSIFFFTEFSRNSP